MAATPSWRRAVRQRGSFENVAIVAPSTINLSSQGDRVAPRAIRLDEDQAALRGGAQRERSLGQDKNHGCRNNQAHHDSLHREKAADRRATEGQPMPFVRLRP